MQIRNIIGDMPFDKDGRHATGREVLIDWKPAQSMIWRPEYEGDPTCIIETTETDAEYESRCMES